ncbi:hypothetical protein NQ314_020442 [Rhamnusium bicolor]|uniref:Uncharacterized protein n=1 Tax=Rhamnusium bicolor TaxID=1586634 RepID=A0AAV8WL33_9CUCU|nr:hypothetical protein NQ314_020442 [Rhamnusium bicolor]
MESAAPVKSIKYINIPVPWGHIAEKLQFGRRYGDLTVEAATALLTRSITPVENGRYKFTFDQRLKNVIDPLRDFHYIIETIKEHPVTCPVLMILGNESTLQQEYMQPVLQQFKKQKNVIIKVVDGNHDVHNVQPENVALYVSKFLINKEGKL